MSQPGAAPARDLWIATSNRKKRLELERLLAPLHLRLHTTDELAEPFAPVEDAPDFAGNARIKAAVMARLARGVAIADDSGLSVDALGGRPGVHSARYGGPGLDDRGRLLRLLAEMNDVTDDQRTARFTCNICLCGPDGNVRLAVEDHCEGLLLRAPRGEDGFGYDPAFVARACLGDATPPTFAELAPDRKDAISHRGKALRRLLRELSARPELLRG